MLNKNIIAALVIFILTIMLVTAIALRGEPIVISTNLENLPMEIAGYKGKEDFFTDAVYKELNADKHVYRHYVSANDEIVNLYIGYYGTAKGGRTAHNPYACLPGAGWGIEEIQTVKLHPENYSGSVTVNYLRSRRGDSNLIVVHWYQSAGNKVLPTGIHQNIQRFIGRVFFNRNDGAYVQVSALTDSRNIEETKFRTLSFAEEVLNLLPQYWPVER